MNADTNERSNRAGKKLHRGSCNGKQSTGRCGAGASGASRQGRRIVQFSSVLCIILILALSVSALTISISGSPTKSVSLNGARIEWNTDIASTSRVDYGKTPALGQVKESLAFSTFHTLTLDDLQANTKYYYRLTSIAQNGDFTSNDNGGAMFTLNTNAGADAVPPVFSDLRPLYFGDTTTTFAWTTNEPATSIAYFGKDDLATVSDDALVAEHVLVVPTQSGQLYNFNIAGCDASDNCANGSSLKVLAGAQNGIPPLTADIPSVISTNKLTIRGTTRPFATIELFLDGVKRNTITASGDGTFVAPNVLLSSGNSTIKLVVTDVNSNKVEQSYSVAIDNTPPNVKLNKIPDIADSSPLTVSGSVDEPVTITYEVKKSFDSTEPDRVTGVKTTDVEDNTISLAWTESPEDDVREYAVYRDGVRITTVTTTEYDDAVSSGATYSYRISAVDQSCNEGAQSDSLVVKSASGGNTFTGSPTEAVLTCTTEKQTLEANGQFSFSLGLEDGANQYKISISDLAGNVDEYEGTVRLDSTAPTFIETNLDRLSPTYIPEVTVQGKVSEPATVFVYLNGETTPQSYEVTDDEGNFKIKVHLKIGSASKSANDVITGNVVLEAGVGVSTNKIRLEAVDLAGLKATQGPVEIKYALCGEGGAFDVDMGEISPSILTPRNIIEGVQTIGFSVNLSYRGPYTAVITKKPSIRPLTLSLESEDRYDNGWVQSNFIQAREKTQGYIQFSFVAQPPEDGHSTPDKEKELFEHRLGECTNPAAGCAKFLYQFNIEYQEEKPKSAATILTDQTTGTVAPLTQTQKICIPIEVHMDKPINLGDKLPKKLYEVQSRLMGDAIGYIDKILKPLTVIGEYTIYSCFALTAVNYVLEVKELVECDFASIPGIFSSVSGDKFDRKVAEIGMCDKVYAEDKDKQNQCNDCYKSIRDKLNLKDTMREVCDRVACPAAPTLQTYINQKAGSPPKVVSAAGTDAEGNNYYSGSSCGFNGKEKLQSAKSDIEYTTPQEGPTVDTSTKSMDGPVVTDTYAKAVTADYNSIKEQYKNYLKHEKDTSTKVGEDAKDNKEGVNCAGPHPANAECCGSEYYEEWNSACGLPGVYAETFNEIKESACLAAQRANDIPKFESETGASCGGLLGATGITVAYTGICDPNKLSAQPEFISTHVNYDATILPTKADPEAIIMIVPDTTGKKYEIFSGYATRDITVTAEDAAKIGSHEKVPITQTSNYIKLLKLTAFNEFDVNKKEDNLKKFAAEYCGQPGIAKDPSCTGAAKKIYDQIEKFITTSDKEYIVQPADEGIFRSMQCVCLPAVSGYLQHWRAVLGAIKTCVDHVRITGEGSSGACNELYSNLICDVIYDVLRCFVKGFNNAGSGTSETRDKGLGDVIGILTKAGANTEKSVEDRYGTTALYKTAFSEGNLVHGACMWAFTGEWDLNVGGLFQQTVKNTPLESTGFVFPAERSYVNYNPASSPKGLTTWLYHIGVQFVAGADADYRLYLRCSNSRTCEERDGYKGNLQGRSPGACDCYGQTEQTLEISDPSLGSGHIGQNEDLGADIRYLVQGESGVGQIRYDTVVFEYSYKDATGQTKTVKKEAEIHLTGSDAPNFCSLKLLGTPFFSCVFGGDYVGAIFDGDPKITPAPLLKDSKVHFNVPITLFGDSNPRDTGGASSGANTKYLVYEIRNGANTVVETNKPTDPYAQDKLIRIETSGSNTKTFDSINPISESMFGATTGGVPADFISYYGPNPSSPDSRVAAKKHINPGATTVTETSSLVDLAFNFTAAGVKVYAPAVVGEKVSAVVNGNNFKEVGSATLSGKKLTFRDDGRSGGLITLTLLEDVPPGGVLYLRYQSSGASNACLSASTTPQTWHINFKLFDAKKTQYGATYEPNYQQPTTDAEGQIQEKTITVDAICATNYAGASGYPSGVLPCKIGEKSEMVGGCFCGTKEDAETKCLPGSQCYNCGPDQTINAGKSFCNKDAAGTFSCDDLNKPLAAPTPSSPVLSGISFVELNPDKSYSTAVKIVSAGKVLLASSVVYGVRVNVDYPSPLKVTFTYKNTDGTIGTFNEVQELSAPISARTIDVMAGTTEKNTGITGAGYVNAKDATAFEIKILDTASGKSAVQTFTIEKV